MTAPMAEAIMHVQYTAHGSLLLYTLTQFIKVEFIIVGLCLPLLLGNICYTSRHYTHCPHVLHWN